MPSSYRRLYLYEVITLAKEPNNSAKGKRDNQKMKPFFVMQYLLKNTDENKRVTAEFIRDLSRGGNAPAFMLY